MVAESLFHTVVAAWCNDAFLTWTRLLMQLAWPPSHTHPDGTLTAPSLSPNPFPFPGENPLKSIMGFGEGGTLDPMKSRPTGPCQEASTSSHKAARLPQPILLATVPAASVSTMGGCWRRVERKQFLLPSSGAAQLWPLNPEAFLHPFKASCQEPQGAELCIRWCKPPTPPSELPWPITMSRLHRGPLLPTETRAEFSLQ